MQKVKVEGRLVQKLEWKQTDRQTEDGSDCITPPRAKGDTPRDQFIARMLVRRKHWSVEFKLNAVVGKNQFAGLCLYAAAEAGSERRER